jgi:transposase InsO family protein
MLELVREHPRFGYRRIAKLLQREGHRIGFDRAYRLWRREGLKVARKPKKKRRLGNSDQGCIRHRAERRNHVWAWDFVFDSTSSGSSLKWLAIIDEYTRECLALKVSRRIRHDDVMDVLRGLFIAHGIPDHIRSDNGPKFIASGLRQWLAHSDVGPLYISPGSPWENGYAESFNSRLRDEMLGCEVFDDVQSAQAVTRTFCCSRLPADAVEHPAISDFDIKLPNHDSMTRTSALCRFATAVLLNLCDFRRIETPGK